MSRLKVGILGATGVVGQKYIHLLQDHPWFEVAYVAASCRSAGRRYDQAVEGRWHMDGGIPENAAGLEVMTLDDFGVAAGACDFVFSALDSATAAKYEEKYADYELPVVSNASAHRWTKDVPVLIPEINGDHTEIIPVQQKRRGWKRGFIVAKPNCSIQSYLLPLYAVHRQFKVRKVLVTTLQAVSGAGYPGHSSYDMLDNTIPYIKGEEEKTEREPLKIFGTVSNGEIVNNADIKISAHCNRVPVIDGHTACVSFACEKRPSMDAVIEAWNSFTGLPQELNLPSAPNPPVIYRSEQDRPQPRLDRDAQGGMAVVTGRLRECGVLHYRFAGLSHNTVRGAAGGGILNAELLKMQGYL